MHGCKISVANLIFTYLGDRKTAEMTGDMGNIAAYAMFRRGYRSGFNEIRQSLEFFMVGPCIICQSEDLQDHSLIPQKMALLAMDISVYSFIAVQMGRAYEEGGSILSLTGVRFRRVIMSWVWQKQR